MLLAYLSMFGIEHMQSLLVAILLYIALLFDGRTQMLRIRCLSVQTNCSPEQTLYMLLIYQKVLAYWCMYTPYHLATSPPLDWLFSLKYLFKTKESWLLSTLFLRRRPDLNRWSGCCRPMPYRLATSPYKVFVSCDEPVIRVLQTSYFCFAKVQTVPLGYVAI